MVILVDLPLKVVDDRFGLAFVVFCVRACCKEGGLGVYKGFLDDEIFLARVALYGFLNVLVFFYAMSLSPCSPIAAGLVVGTGGS